LRTDYAAIPYNSALLMLLTGAALVAIARRLITPGRIAASAGLLLSALTMTQYFTGTDLGLDQLLMQHYVSTPGSAPGRMALTTAFSYLILDTGLLLFTLHHGNWSARVLATTCGALAIAAVIATVIGYKADLRPLFGWSANTYMAPQSALGIFLLALGLLTCSLHVNEDNGEESYLPLAAAGFIVVASATLLLWSGLVRQRDEQMQNGLDADLRQLGIGINALYQEHVNILERMGRRWETGNGTPKMVWESDTRSYLDSLSGVRAMYWIDGNGRVQWKMPTDDSSLAAVTDVATQPELAAGFLRARDSHKTSFTKPDAVAADDVRFYVLRPLFVGNRFDGCIVTEFRASALFEQIGAQDPTIPFMVNFGGSTYYRNPLTRDLAGIRYISASSPLSLTDGGWSLQVLDSAELRAGMRNLLPEVVLGVGLVLAAFFAAVLGLWGRSRRHLLQAGRANVALEASRRQLNQFRTTLDHTLDCVFIIDANSLNFIYGNDGALRTLGYTPDQLYGKRPWDVSTDLSEEQFIERSAPLIRHEVAATTFDMVLRNQGDGLPVECFLQYIAPADEKPRFVAMMRDITQRKRIEQMKSEFVSTVSHELRTPLTSISGALGLVSGGALGEVPPALMEMVDIALKNSKRLTYLINDLLDIEKLAAGKVHFDLQIQPLMPLVEQIVEGTRSYGSEHKVGLAIVERVSDIEVRVDSQRLLQILGNLLSNAIKFSPEGGTVEVTVARKADKVRISVRDHGRGIPEEFRNRIFQKFAQADASDSRKQSGTGLGLAISRELAERMSGSLNFDSTVIEGACFHLELPVIHSRFVPQPTGTAATANGARLLVVEDDHDAALLIRKMLTDAGYAVDVAHTGAASLQALESHAYAAVVLDLLLPDMNGIDIIRRMKSQAATAALPIVVVSARAEDGRLTINGDFSGIVWLAKPVDHAHLLQEINQIVAKTDSLPCRVLHVEDDVDLHTVIRGMVGGNCEFSLATTLHSARQHLVQDRFTAIILDLVLPDGTGWDLLPDIHARQPDARLIILTGTDTTPLDLDKVDSILLKSRVTPAELLAAIHSRVGSII
ncbi:MAG TPA: ATP-binding protein, partial [Candidatus Acidoferrum sp.]|nr:ATP-binding protein [Candidatus Acidoferrum sp.]